MQSMIEPVQNLRLASFFSGSDYLTNASTHLLPSVFDAIVIVVLISSNTMFPWLCVIIYSALQVFIVVYNYLFDGVFLI